MSHTIVWRRCCAFVLACLIAGCGGSSEFTLHPVSGKITKGGQPLPDITVSLVPADATIKAPPMIGRTDDQGQYSIRTVSGETGCPEGTFKIVLTAPAPEMNYSDRKAKPTFSDVIPKPLTSASSTDQSITVVAGSNVKDIDVK
ncbi:MAG: hypothetical protein SFV23_18560 [Planctomycetaceae bacterium]|nr:hypothetical protein [Planctomycetaceae bacterium]